jgi:alginate O-acetyltransferase complex protein AlgI
MLFNSSTFLFFFTLVFTIYYVPIFRQLQVWILVIASFIFYAWSSPWLLNLLLLSILINTITSYQVIKAHSKNKRILWAIAGIVINLSVLALFKYGSLFTSLFIDIGDIPNSSENKTIDLLLHLPLPIGISFYTFEGISLLVDAYKHSEQKGDKSLLTNNYRQRYNPLNYLLNTSHFITFFPHLIAGPILKANDFYPQICVKFFKDIPWDIVFRSLTTGYFLKMVIADNLKDYTFWITYPYFLQAGTLTNVVLLFGYSMQIFADFAGYSLIAIGLAASLGYTLPENFNFPYISSSISEFWRRWHISLSTWLRDYLYIPLGGSRKGNIRTYVNLMVVMTLGGLWHGAAWSYAVWGIFHGVGLALERFLGWHGKFKKFEESQKPLWLKFLADFLRVISVFCFVTLGWLLFKLPKIDEAISFLVTLVSNFHVPSNFRLITPVLIYSVPIVIYHLPHFPTFQKKNTSIVHEDKGLLQKSTQDLITIAMLVLIILNSGSSNEFIYFQF